MLICPTLLAEGELPTALSLARTYAAAGLETLLIDFDSGAPVPRRDAVALTDIRPPR